MNNAPSIPIVTDASDLTPSDKATLNQLSRLWEIEKEIRSLKKLSRRNPSASTPESYRQLRNLEIQKKYIQKAIMKNLYSHNQKTK